MNDEDKTIERIGKLIELADRASDDKIKEIICGHVDRLIKEWDSEASAPPGPPNMEWGFFQPADVLRDLGFTEQEIQGNQELAAKEIERLYREAKGELALCYAIPHIGVFLYPMEFWGEARSLLAGMFVSGDPGYLDF